MFLKEPNEALKFLDLFFFVEIFYGFYHGIHRHEEAP